MIAFSNRSFTGSLMICLIAMCSSVVMQRPLSAQSLDGSRLSGGSLRQVRPPVSMHGSSATASYPRGGYYQVPMANSRSGGRLATQSTMAHVPVQQLRTLAPADTSWAAKKEVKNRIPWSKLNADATRRIKDVLESASIYRRLPVNQIACDPNFFTFALRNPDTIVNMWEVFGVSQMALTKKAPFRYSGNDGSGTNCNVELIYGDSTQHIYYGTGTYQGPIFKRKITGRCVVVVRTDYRAGGRQYALSNKLDVFIKIDNLAADMIARTLQPMVGRTADHNFKESLAFLQAFSQTAVTDPRRTEYLIKKLGNVSAETKQQFQRVVGSIGQRQKAYIASRNAQARGRTVTSPGYSGPVASRANPRNSRQ